MLNSYFNNFTYGREQHLLESLVIESIKQYGYNIYYIPRTIVRDDPLFGEDTLSMFEQAAELEVYIKNVEGFEGDGDFLSKFNLEIRDSITFVLSRKRFDQAKSEKISSENGYNLLQEGAATKTPSRQFLSTAYEGFSFLLEDATSLGYSITSNRPLEGDVIYFALTKKFFEIKFVKHDAIFHQLGRLQSYELRCELFEYSSERFETGISEIDDMPDTQSADVLDQEILMEGTPAFNILNENGGSIMIEYRLEDNLPTANNEYLSSSPNDPIFSSSGVLDFSEGNPFVTTQKW